MLKIGFIAVAASFFMSFSAFSCTPELCAKIADAGNTESYIREQLLGSDKANIGLPGSIIHTMATCKRNCKLKKHQLQFLRDLSVIPAVSMLAQFAGGYIKNDDLTVVMIPVFVRELQIYYQSDKSKYVESISPDIEKKLSDMLDKKKAMEQ
jgi:hypothetical protein